MYNKHLYCFVMSSKTQMADIRLDSDEISFLKKNEIEYQKKLDNIGNLFSVDCSQLKEKFCNC